MTTDYCTHQVSFPDAILMYELARQEYEKKLKFINNDDQNGIGLCYVQIGWCYMREKSTDQALEYYLKGLKLCTDNSILLDAYLGLCDCYFTKTDFDQALVYYNKAIEYTDDKEALQKINLFLDKSICYQYKLDYEQALEECKTCLKLIILNQDNKQQQSVDKLKMISLKYYKKCLELCSSAITTTEQQKILNNKPLYAIMCLYYIVGDNKIALDYAFKYLRILEAIELRETQEQIELAKCYNSIGHIYYWNNEYKLALDYCQEAIDLYQLLTLEIVDQQQAYANAWSSLAVIYYQLDQISECVDCCQKSMEIFYKTSTTAHFTVGFNYELYANLHLKNGQHWVAEEFYKKALDIIKTHAPYELQVISRIENKLINMFVEQS
ncbi:unnamed protein product [Didymodactylos carnosus]|uniref:Tetratricopeptide repeat protein n=1 Tax=Didymodactylos carnosus TaxID=1234261 RepID=A0A8S2EVC0_9BILA|nr:unnamed protein product [Didymodactylos carnosus]CAF4057771.1 unnamed protein product [Didymodactylos carnosus]